MFLLYALAHAIPVALAALFARSSVPVHLAGAGMVIFGFAYGSAPYSLFDAGAAGVAWFLGVLLRKGDGLEGAVGSQRETEGRAGAANAGADSRKPDLRVEQPVDDDSGRPGNPPKASSHLPQAPRLHKPPSVWQGAEADERVPAGHGHALPPGWRVGDYRIERFLGAGSFGVTYLAEDEQLGRNVAIKEYLPSDWAIRRPDRSVVAKSSRDQDDFRWGLERFSQEAKSLARFDHPNVARAFRYFTAQGTGFLVMEYIDGGPLGEMLLSKGTLSQAEIERHVLPVLDGLEQLHDAGLLHRDVKPDNIVLRDDGSPVLVDFGAARQEAGARSRSVTSLVTRGYAPLEQYSTNARQGPATDIYAFAAVLFRCATGRTPVDATDRSLGEEQIPVSEAAMGTYGTSFLAAVDAALAPKMQDRPQNVAEFRNMLCEKGAIRDSVVTRQTVSRRRHARPTNKQLKFIDTLRRERHCDGLDDVRPETRGDASKLIDDLKARPRRLP